MLLTQLTQIALHNNVNEMVILRKLDRRDIEYVNGGFKEIVELA